MTKEEIENLENAFILKVDEFEKFVENWKYQMPKRYKKHKPHFGFWKQYRMLSKKDAPLFITDFMEAFNCTLNNFYYYASKKATPLKPEAQKKITQLFAKYNIKY
jgi:hypothetical protein